MVSFNGKEGVLREEIARLEAKVRALQADEERTSIALAQSGRKGVRNLLLTGGRRAW